MENCYFAHQILQVIKGILWQTKNKSNQQVISNPVNLPTRRVRTTDTDPGTFGTSQDKNGNRGSKPRPHRPRLNSQIPRRRRNVRKDQNDQSEQRDRNVHKSRPVTSKTGNPISRSSFRSIMRPSRSQIYRARFATFYNGRVEIMKLFLWTMVAPTIPTIFSARLTG